MKKSVLLGFALMLVAVASLRAQLVINYVPDATWVHYESGNSALSFKREGIPLNYDFGATPGADTVQITMSAPAGKMFVGDIPAGAFTGAKVGLRFGASRLGFTEPSVFGYGAGSLGGLSGALGDEYSDWLIIYYVPVPTASFNVHSEFLATVGTTVSFRSFTYTATIPETFTGAFNGTGSLVLFMQAISYSPTSDPGLWFTLQDAPAAAVPEPSTYATITGGAVLGLAAWLRRRAARASA